MKVIVLNVIWLDNQLNMTCGIRILNIYFKSGSIQISFDLSKYLVVFHLLKWRADTSVRKFSASANKKIYKLIYLTHNKNNIDQIWNFTKQAALPNFEINFYTTWPKIVVKMNLNRRWDISSDSFLIICWHVFLELTILSH